MIKQDRRKLSILIVLLGVLGLTLVLAYRMNQPDTTSAVQPPPPKPSTNPSAPSDARIRLDLVEGSEDAPQDIGKRNLFQYQQAPPPPPPVPPRGSPPTNVNTTTTVQISVPPQPPRPPAPPPISLKYQGFAATSAPNRGFTAFLADESRHYNVTVGEILMGRYRIVGITDKSVDVEDLEYNRRQTLPLLK